tara:strand:- start:232 stop:942 length:711 start_codon:yes stop_codon:yes gene_type:complete
MSLPLVNTAKFSVKLPGCGLNVEYRPFFVKEQKVLMQATESEDPAQITLATADMIKACTFNELDVDDLTSTDVEYLLLKIRSKSVGEKTKIGLKCKHCETSNEIEMDLSKIEPKGDAVEEQKISINDKIGVAFRMPTIGKLRSFMEVSGGTATDTLIATMAAAVEYVYDAESVYPSKEQKPEEIIQFLESLSTEQFKHIQSAFDNFPRLMEEISFKCKSCGEENNFQLGGLSDFLG